MAIGEQLRENPSGLPQVTPLNAVMTARYTEHRLAALNAYFGEGNVRTKSALLMQSLQASLEGPTAPNDITLPATITANIQATRAYLRETFAAFQEHLGTIQGDDLIVGQIRDFLKRHHKHFAWASAENGLLPVNEGMNLRLRRLDSLDEIPELADWFQELGINQPVWIMQKHLLGKADREALVTPLLPYGFQTIEPLTDTGVQLQLTRGQYRHALEVGAEIMEDSPREIAALVSEGTWTIDPGNFQAVRRLDGTFFDNPTQHPEGKPFAQFDFVLDPAIAGPDESRRRIGTATPDGRFRNQWDFAAGNPRRRAILTDQTVAYDLGVYGQIRPRGEFIANFRRNR